MSGLTAKLQIDPKWDKSGTFSDQISVHFGAVRSPGFVPFGTNLAHLGPKSVGLVVSTVAGGDGKL